jgi:hypothetical protein
MRRWFRRRERSVTLVIERHRGKEETLAPIVLMQSDSLTLSDDLGKLFTITAKRFTS